MLGTYAAALIVCASALLVGQAVLVACGWRRWSWLAPVVGLGPVIAVAWGAVQLPGEGTAALGAVAALSVVSLLALAGRVEGLGDALREGLPAAAITLLAASIPFVVEGRFGVLGTGFNVDMSQHLFAADWLADPAGSEPGLVEQGYPLGPHGLAVAAAEPGGGNLVQGFSGMTIAVPVLAALCSLTVLRGLLPLRRALGAALVALPYMVASYLAQGQFKELLEGLFLLGFALCLHQFRSRAPLSLARTRTTGSHSRSLSRPPRAGWAWDDRRQLLAAVPLAAIALGALYSYSAPGLAWLGGAALLFCAAELVRRRPEGVIAVARSAALPVVVGLVVLLAGAAPELSRVADFRSNAAEVADAGDPEPAGSGRPDLPEESADAPGGGSAAQEGNRGQGEGREFNSDLGNLFDEISPLEALGIWPSGDFRVEPGAGAAPAVVFYAGAALAAVALLLALGRWLRRGETAVPAALVAAATIYVAAWALSTPYAAAKAVMLIAPLAMLIVVRELLPPEVLSLSVRSARGLAAAALVAAFLVGAGASTVLALGNAPVGPEDYSPGLARIRSAFEGRPTLVLADPERVEDEHARDFLGWEARGADPLCIEPAPGGTGGPPPEGFRYVVTTEGQDEPPFENLSPRRAEGPYALWELRGAARGKAPVGPAGDPTNCGLGV